MRRSEFCQSRGLSFSTDRCWMAKACNYTLTLWEKLNRFLEYLELELSNNLSENSGRNRTKTLDPRGEPAGRDRRSPPFSRWWKSSRRLKLPVRAPSARLSGRGAPRPC